MRLGESGTTSIVDPVTAQGARLGLPCTPTTSSPSTCVFTYNAMAANSRRATGLRSYSVPDPAAPIHRHLAKVRSEHKMEGPSGDAVARGIVASIADYVISVQTK